MTLGVTGALTGDGNTAAAFDGVDDSVQVPDAAALDLNGSWSIEFWARQVSFANSLPGILDKGDATTPHGYAIWADSSGDLWFERHNRDAEAGSGALTSAFRYFVVTYDGSDVRWYVDGTLKTTTAVHFPTNNGSAILELGRAVDYGNDALDEVALYATALSGGQIAAHYSAGT